MGIQLRNKMHLDPLTVQYGDANRTPPKLRWAMVVLIVSIPFIILLYQLVKEYVLIRFAGLVVYDTMIIRAPEDGYIQDLSVKVGQKIVQGQKILKFVSPQMTAKLNALIAEKARVTALMNLIKNQNLTPLENLLNVLKVDIQSSNDVFKSLKNYIKSGDLAVLQVEEARKNYVNAQRNYVEIEQQIKETQLRNQTMIEVNYQRQIFELENQILQLQAQIARYTVFASTTGTVMNIFTYNGEFVMQGQNLVNIVTNKNIKIEAFIDGKYITDIYPNRKVTVTFPDKEVIPGHIVNVPSYAEKVPLSLSNPLATRENKVIVYIQLDAKFPENYDVYGIPVRVKIIGLGL